MPLEYTRTDELPDAGITWRNSDGEVIDFSGSTHTFVLKIYDDEGAVLLTKSSGITGAATAPNVTIAWSEDDLDIEEGTWPLRITATRNADDKTRTARGQITILPIAS